MPHTLTLLADIGGTNTRVALAENGRLRTETIRRYLNAEAPGLEAHLGAYLTDLQPGVITACSVALAGPVQDGMGEMTNLDWRVTPQGLRATTGAEHVSIINDLQAQGYALSGLNPADLMPVLPGSTPPQKGATKLVVNLGTGFNIAPVYVVGGQDFVPPSESGHATLPRARPRDIKLAEALEKPDGFAAIEDALSGRGLVAIHRALAREDLPGREIIERLAQGDRRATKSARAFVELLGTVAGDLALVHLPLGGIYLVGGMARAISPWLGPLGFAEAFRAKGRFAGFMEQFAINLVTDDNAALIGCARALR